MREIVRHVQNARKKAELNVDDRIELSLQTDDNDMRVAIKEHASTIKTETLAVELLDEFEQAAYSQTVTVDGQDVTIKLAKANI